LAHTDAPQARRAKGKNVETNNNKKKIFKYMKLSAALEYENIRRNPADWNKIYLNHDGKFYHAYDW
jgi:hypothetical protein